MRGRMPQDVQGVFARLRASATRFGLTEFVLVVLTHRDSQYMKALHIDWLAVVDAIGYPAAGLGILIESAGVPFPGEALLLAAAAWAAARHYSIVLVIIFGFLGATVGADLGYFLGHRGGRPFVERFGHLFR